MPPPLRRRLTDSFKTSPPATSKFLSATARRSRRARLAEVVMKPRLKVLTLAVDDLERSLAFYRDGLGLETKGITGTQFEHGAVVFIQMDEGLILALWPAASLALDARITPAAERLGSVSLGHIVGSTAEVDAVIAQAAAAGAVVTDPPRERFWGGYRPFP
jgi:uncharacterized protein